MAILFEILSVCKGGGYRYCRTHPPHPKRNSNGLYPLHRVLLENKLGRLLGPDEIAHHDDENKTNDSPDNLLLYTRSEHGRLHRLPLDPVAVDCRCGKKFFLAPHKLRQRKVRSKTGDIYCSRSCAGRFS